AGFRGGGTGFPAAPARAAVLEPVRVRRSAALGSSRRVRRRAPALARPAPRRDPRPPLLVRRPLRPRLPLHVAVRPARARARRGRVAPRRRVLGLLRLLPAAPFGGARELRRLLLLSAGPPALAARRGRRSVRP